jgi:hypothetical protein
MRIPEPYELLILASQLSILTYYLGVLLYVLPIPDYRVKKWAPILIRDGLWMAVLASAFTIILAASDLIAAYSGLTIRETAILASNVITNVYSVNFFYRLVAAILSALPGMSSSLLYAIMLPFFFMQYGIKIEFFSKFII